MNQKVCNMMSSLRFGEILRNKPYIVMLFVQAIYAGMALLSKASIPTGMSPFVFVVYGQAFATLSLAPFACFFGRKNAAQLSSKLLLKIFFTSLVGNTLSLNLYYFAINHTSATYGAAATNLIPAITFVIALTIRMESVCLKQWHGWAKVIGSILCFSGAFVFAFVKGPTINFMRSQGDDTSKVPIVKEYPLKPRSIMLQCFSSLIQATVWAVAMEQKLSSWKLGWDVNLVSVAYCGIVITALTYCLRLWSIEKKGPVFTAMFTPLALIITAIVSAFLWKETFYVGRAILLTGGLYCVLLGKNKELISSKVDEEKSLEMKEEVT